jgi:hypothetical protein
VRVAVRRRARQADAVEQLGHPRPARGAIADALDDQRLAQRRADLHPRVE